METKICTMCKLEKEIENFNNDKKGKNGKSARCKECSRKMDRERYLKRKNDKNYIKYHKEYTKNHYKYYNKKYAKNKNEYQKEYYLKHKEEVKKYNKKYNEKNKEEIKEKRKKYYQKNKKIINRKQKEREQNDYIFKLKNKIRKMIHQSFKRKKISKLNNTQNIIGCDIDFFIKYLINTYEKNYNEKWDWKYLSNVAIDHIIPLATAKTEEEVIKLCHYTNLQLLTKKDNLDKRDKLDWRIE